MARQVPPPPDYPFTPDDWEGGIGRCSSCDGSGIDPRLPDEQCCDECGGSGQVSPPDAYLAAMHLRRKAVMTVEQLLKMSPDAAMAWLKENGTAFELVPVTPTEEMIKAAAGPDFTQEDRELVTREWVDMIDTHRHGYSIVA